MKTGLVLEGGAMRGIYTAGVLDVFMERDYILMELSECQQGHFTDVLLCQDRKAEVSATLRNTEMTDIS